MNLADFLNYYSAQVLDSAFIMSHFVNLDSNMIHAGKNNNLCRC